MPVNGCLLRAPLLHYSVTPLLRAPWRRIFLGEGVNLSVRRFGYHNAVFFGYVRVYLPGFEPATSCCVFRNRAFADWCLAH